MRPHNVEDLIDYAIRAIKKEVSPGMCGCWCNEFEEYYCAKHWAEVMAQNSNYHPKEKMCRNLK